MNTPVSFTVAKLLKEKGFDKQCLRFYTNPRCKMFGIDEHGRYYPIKNRAKKLWLSGKAATLYSKHVFYAPTIADVIMWLYEKYEIWVAINPFYTMEGKRFSSDVWKNNYKISVNHFKTPTDAYEAAIEYSLVNLVK